ncbi:hypothetical protein PSAKL28_52150 [Pseudomonas alkylphenolica]|uniref:Uncharacterized protein n=1 Tax=Pseudomonas alkylphenolica TaxID=237609 RepID=A0A077FIM8_9PSED|nr:hypothetical protein PSAKL28_52150 [Pseudomonas alkylphenolica]
MQLGVIGDFLEQAALFGVAFDRAAVLHAALIFLLLLAGLGVGLIRAIEFTSHCISP